MTETGPDNQPAPAAPSSRAASSIEQPLDILHDDLLLELVCDLLRQGREATFAAHGSSMHPVIRDGDRVTVAPADARDLSPGTVALYLAELPSGGQGIVIHRLLTRLPGGKLSFRGDACPLPDPPIGEEQVIGRIVGVRHKQKEFRSSGWIGRQLLAGGSFLPRMLARLSKWKSRITERKRIPFLPVTHGRLLRERDLIQLSLGSPDVIAEIEDAPEPLRLPPHEYDLLPLILYRLREEGIDPEGLLPVEAPSIELDASVRSARMEAALHWIASAMNDADETLLLTKGAALAWEFYPQPHLRPAADIDVLARPGRESAVLEALLAAGAALAEPEYTISYYLRFKNEVALRLPGARWPVLEIHWRGGSSAWYNSHGDREYFWRDNRSSRFGDSLRVMPAEAEFVHSVAHLAKHLPHLRLMWAVDMALLANRVEDWDTVVESIFEQNLALPGAVVCRWFEDHVPGVLPEGITARFAEHALANAGCLERTLLMRGDDMIGRLAEAWCQPDLPSRLGYFRRVLLPERRTLERMFPGARGRSLVLLHALRLARLARHGAPGFSA